MLTLPDLSPIWVNKRGYNIIEIVLYGFYKFTLLLKKSKIV